MKLTWRDIQPYLDAPKPKHAVILIYGPDHGLVKERAALLGRKIVADLNDAFNTATFTGDQVGTDPARFIDETRSLSMMGGDRLIRVQDATDGLTAVLKSYLKEPSPGTTIILEAGDLGLKSSLRAACERDNNAVTLPCYVADAADLSKTINNTIRAAGLRIDPDATAFLSNAIGGDTMQVKGELEKLLTYMNVDAGGKGNGATITIDDAIACSGAMGLANLDNFIDAFMGGDVDTALTLLTRLHEDGIVDIVILRSLMAQGRKIHQVHLMMGDGLDATSAIERLQPPVFFKRKPAFIKQVRTHTPARLTRLMNDLLTLEGKMKSSGVPDAVLPQTILSLCARASRAAA